jgi:hypothetical protein
VPGAAGRDTGDESGVIVEAAALYSGAGGGGDGGTEGGTGVTPGIGGIDHAPGCPGGPAADALVSSRNWRHACR